MIGIDHNSARVTERGLFAFTASQIQNALTDIRGREGIKGCAIISTCNRTELWASEEECGNNDLIDLICEAKGLYSTDGKYKELFVARENDEAVAHLFETACGLRSQVLGEDQILAQVKTAIKQAREARAADDILEKLFQTAIASAKRVKTEIRVTTADASVAHAAIKKAREYKENLSGVKCLVIGNGEMGRLTAELLVLEGAEVSITLRKHKQGKNSVPDGCKVADYDRRYEIMPECDIIVSATISPHYTIKKESAAFIASAARQFLFIDLSVPRDIDERIADFENAVLIDMDHIGMAPAINQKALAESKRIIAKYIEKFYKWYFRKRAIMSNAKIFVIGTGPGEISQMTGKAHDALLSCDIIIGYQVYVDLVAEHFPGKELIASPMTKEAERCELAAKKALEGKTVAVISSGDAGVYGMAGIMLETAQKYGAEVEVIPGVTAALSGGAVLGAPLANDFAVISLSDLLTPWSVIEKRLSAAAAGDFAIAIYNPGSKTRREHLEKACRILLRHKPPDTPCGIVRNIGRNGQSYRLTTLSELAGAEVDMFMTIFVGNEQTIISGEKMITKRGYKTP